MFAAWARLVYRRRWIVLVLSLLVFAVSAVVLAQGGSLNGGGISRGESSTAAKLIDEELPHTGGSSFTLIFSSRSLRVDSARFRSDLLAALRSLQRDPRVSGITTPYNAPPAMAAMLRSYDGKRALVIVALKDSQNRARHYYPQLRALVHPRDLGVAGTGQVALNQAFDRYLAQDLRRAERVSLPLALILLLLVFGTVVAALLPLGVGGLAIVGGLAGVFLLNRVTDVSQYALNIVTLVGLGVAIDYSLFIVNRFREELERGATVEESLARALATAGRAITFSGLTVAIGLSGMLFYQGTFLASMGVAGAIGVGCAVFYGLTFLPALLGLLGPRVSLLRLPFAQPRSGRGFWGHLALLVMRRPVPVLVLTVPCVLAAGLPFVQLQLANADVSTLPPQAEAYRAYQTLQSSFPGQNQTAIPVVVSYPSGTVLSAERVGALYDLSRRIARLHGVAQVRSIVTPDPRLGRADYQRLYTGPRELWPAPVRALVHQTVGRHIVLLTVLSARASESEDARSIVRAIRGMAPGAGGQLLVTGRTAIDIDTIDLIRRDTVPAVIYIVLATALVLFLLLGSVVLPVKAVITDVLSITASFGALVWIFQQGHLHEQLSFTPAPLDSTVPVLLFCIVFGLSMDYEVLLLSRIKEAYERTGDNTAAVAEGLERSGRLITGAAAIMIGVFAAFALAGVTIIKAIGLGMAIAVAVDATIVRALIVPATMRLLGRYNWWAPRPLGHLYRRLSLGERHTATAEESRS